jgi:hypothetical protein
MTIEGEVYNASKPLLQLNANTEKVGSKNFVGSHLFFQKGENGIEHINPSL